jgi:hypothetical protein
VTLSNFFQWLQQGKTTRGNPNNYGEIKVFAIKSRGEERMKMVLNRLGKYWHLKMIMTMQSNVSTDKFTSITVTAGL